MNDILSDEIEKQTKKILKKKEIVIKNTIS